MSTRHDDPDSRLSWLDRLVLVCWLVGGVALSALPLAVGVVVSLVIPGLSKPNTAIPMWAFGPLLFAVFVVALVVDTPIERLVARLTRALPRWIRVTASEAAGLGVLWCLLRPLMADAPSAFIAALVTVLVYLLTSPVVDAMEAKRLRK